MWLPLGAITVTALCVVAVSGNMVRQPMEVDARQENVQQDIVGTEKDPVKELTDDNSNMDVLPGQKRTKPKGISSRIKAVLQKRMAAVSDGVHSGSGKMHRLADQMVGFVKSHLKGDGLERMMVDVPDTPLKPGPKGKKLHRRGKNIRRNWLNHLFKDTKGGTSSV